jgi:lipopolysaccharide/colanic/teichoic acid biosynthesis glycosyltransferase
MVLTMGRNTQMYRHVSKPLIDLVVAGLGLLFLAPLLLALAFIVRVRIGKPVFFRQERAGLDGRPFRIMKFRTMTNSCDAHGRLLPDAQRLTRWGRFLRRISLDELPELMNVLKGEMSLVGPRPLLSKYLERYTPEQVRRHEVKPGITGWAQINGRNAVSWERKFDMDVWYVDHQSLWLDLKIIGFTVWKILKREGINEPGEVTAREFAGSSKEIL